MARWSTVATLLVIGAVALSGCGGGADAGVVVRGQILKGGQPLEVERRDVGLGMVEVRLAPVGGGENQSSLAQADGAVIFQGGGTGIRPGKYKVAVFQRDQGPGTDRLNGAFSETNTPIEIELLESNRGGTQDLGVVDLDAFAKKPAAP